MPPSYFFHLAFELYPYPQPPSPYPTEVPHRDIYLPPTGSNIFDCLPVHKISNWGSSPPARNSHKRSHTAISSADTIRTSNPTRRPPIERRYSHLSGTTPGDPRESPVPLDAKKVTGTASPQAISRDWRFGSVSIQSIDMEPANSDTSTRPKSKAPNTTSDVGSGSASSGGLATKGRFVPSDPKNTEVGWGVVHLYRDGQETPGLYDDSASRAGSNSGKGMDDARAFKEEDCTTLCILAVPSYMTPSDLLGYVGEQTREDVSHFRLIRTARTNKYMVLMKFREANKAGAWRKEWNGKLFNSMEPENCHVVFVKSIEFRTAETNRDPSSFPNMANDPFTPTPRAAPSAPLSTSSPNSVEPSSLATSLSTKPLPPPQSSLVELPTCPVCLERMDETTGLLTILCQHVFHCACLEKWRGSGCPVCRYTQNDPRVGRGNTSDGEAPENECSVCGTTNNLWICLICGNTGCGRYDSAHAYAHYEETSHSYAMDISTQHVWDYAGDGYVHRLIQNKADGKLVDLPAAYRGGRDGGRGFSPTGNGGATGNGAWVAYGEDMVPREKLDNMGMEYAYLLTSQLDSQRCYFEEQVERAVDKAAKAASAADEAVRTATEMGKQLKELQQQYMEARESIASLEKDLARQTVRAESSAQLARNMTKQYQEEKTMNGALMQRIKHLELKSEERERKMLELTEQKRDLEEQNRDLSFFISGGEKLKELREGGELEGDEVMEGKVEVPIQDDKGKRRKGKGRK